jgi:hypothetical protein
VYCLSLEPDKSSHTIRSYFFSCIQRLYSSLYQDVRNGPSHFCELMEISSPTGCYLTSYGMYSEGVHFESWAGTEVTLEFFVFLCPRRHVPR